MIRSALPTIWCYGDYSGSYGSHCMAVEVLGITIYYLYKTPIAFDAPGMGRYVRENDWGPTTGKHLNAIDGGDKKNRVSGEKFEELWNQHVAGQLLIS